MEEKVILVDENDIEIGSEEKIKAHREKKLHRSFSILIYNSKKQLLLQKRAEEKYHTGGLWTNTCCSHPRPNEPLNEAIHRRLKEEKGFDCGLKEILSFQYIAEFDNGLTEHEFNHVFIGKYDKDPEHNSDEVDEWKWMTNKEIIEDIKNNPDKYTPWFKIIIKEHLEELEKNLN